MYLQAELNIGTVGHVDHGKTSVVEMLTGVWADVHSIEVKRGITIKLGYADVVFRKCPNCKGSEAFTTSEKCKICGSPTSFLRKVSFVDAPGHETLMATVIASANIIDGALLVIAANESCPQPQTKEHLIVLETLGIKNVIIVQNKIDLVTPEKAKEHYEQIRKFLSSTIYKNAPIIPVSANYGVNADILIEAIERYIKTPSRDENKEPIMYIARSFDVNKPGTPINKIVGGVIGGSLIQGKLKVGDEIEIVPGIKSENKVSPLKTRIVSLSVGKEQLEEIKPGGLVGILTNLDPSLTKADGLIGNVVGLEKKTPPIYNEIEVEYTLLDRVDFENPSIKQGEIFMVSLGTTTTIATVTKVKKKAIHLALKQPISAMKGTRIALSRKIGQRWRLSCAGKLL